MSDILTSFYYSPIRQGYDSNSWRTISGAPALDVNGRISVDNLVSIEGSAIHYADFVKGDVIFDVNIPVAPVAGVNRIVGLSSPNTASYIWFNFDTSLTCETSDGTTTTVSDDITWDSAWTGANTLFKIRWGAGYAKFFINGVQVYQISDDSVPYGPLSLFLLDGADSSMTIGDVVVLGTQSYVMNLKTSDSSSTNVSGKLSMYQGITVSENVAFFIPSYKIPFTSGEMFDLITMAENLSMLIPTFVPSKYETITISEGIILAPVLKPSIFDSVTVTENYSMNVIS
jgi:hypothetical protein